MTSDREKARFVREEVRHIYITRHEESLVCWTSFYALWAKQKSKGVTVNRS